MFKKLLFTFIGLDIVVINFFVAYLVYAKFKPVPRVEELVAVKNFALENQGACKECVSLESQIAALTSQVEDITLKKDAQNPTTPPTKSVQPQPITLVSYIPIPGSGSTNLTDWTDLGSTAFYFSTVDYPKLDAIYLEVNMRLVNGNGKAYLRLWDATHGVTVADSQVETASQQSVFVSSGKISPYAGTNLYKIQAKSLTADTTVFEGGRLKVISKN